MSNGDRAVIQFAGYRVSNIIYSCSPEFEFPEEGASYKFNFNKNMLFLSDKEIQENVTVNVFFSEQDDINAAPFKITIEIAGRFTSEDVWDPRWEGNALAILFPYLRSLVSVITSNSGREPIILPTVNIASMFE